MAQKLIVMFHSVNGPNRPAAVGAFPVAFDDFRLSVEQYAAAGWAFGRLSAYRHPVDRPTVYLTSDDGTSDWAANVLPWCEDMKIPTHTGLCTGIWREDPIYPLAHLVQVVLAKRPADGLAALADTLWQRISPMARQHVEACYAYETDAARRKIKGVCNLCLPPAEAMAALQPLNDDEVATLSDRFAPPKAYAGLEFAEVGVHTVSHAPLGTDLDGYMNNEVLACRDELAAAGLGGQDAGWFTLPMRPQPGASLDDLLTRLKSSGFVGMLDGAMPPGEMSGDDFAVRRLDAKHFLATAPTRVAA
jgi:hypothetical protein